MVKGKTSTGFVFKLDDDVKDDMELLEYFARFDRGERDLMAIVISKLLGEEQKKRLYDHCRSKKTGRVSAQKVIMEAKEVLDAINASEDEAVKNL